MSKEDITTIVNLIVDKINASIRIPITILIHPSPKEDLEEDEEEDDSYIVEC